MFPFIMIVGALIFFDHKVHARLIAFLKNLFTGLKKSSYVKKRVYEFSQLPYVKQNKFSVVIDPGHGGPDPGAIGIGGIRESDVVLEVSKIIEK